MSEEKPSHRTGTPELVEDACDALEFSDEVSETAKVLYRRVYDEDLYHGRTLETVLAGTVYIACRAVGHACNPTRVADTLGTTREDLLSTSRHLMKRLKIQLQPIDPEPHVHEFVEELGLSAETREKALEIIGAAREAGIHSGKSPTGFAAGAVYAASTLTGERVTQEAIREVSDVSTVTIRNRYQTQLDCYENAQHE
jgi:transcription initiation factor TFIIB